MKAGRQLLTPQARKGGGRQEAERETWKELGLAWELWKGGETGRLNRKTKTRLGQQQREKLGRAKAQGTHEMETGKTFAGDPAMMGWG